MVLLQGCLAASPPSPAFRGLVGQAHVLGDNIADDTLGYVLPPNDEATLFVATASPELDLEDPAATAVAWLGALYRDDLQVLSISDGKGELPLAPGRYVVCTDRQGNSCGAFLVDEDHPVALLELEWRPGIVANPSGVFGGGSVLDPPCCLFLSDYAEGDLWPTHTLVAAEQVLELCVEVVSRQRACDGEPMVDSLPEICGYAADRAPCWHQVYVAHGHFACLEEHGVCGDDGWQTDTDCPALPCTVDAERP